MTYIRLNLWIPGRFSHFKVIRVIRINDIEGQVRHSLCLLVDPINFDRDFVQRLVPLGKGGIPVKWDRPGFDHYRADPEALIKTGMPENDCQSEEVGGEYRYQT
jgi:hypothetical protein